MPAVSQKQQRFMTFTRAVQEGKASGKGYPKVEEAAREMKPTSVEHFMSGKHIDKSFMKYYSKEKEACERGFFKAAVASGIKPLQAAILTKRAALDLAGIEQMMAANPKTTAGIAGGLAGAAGGAMVASKGHRMAGALGGGVLGAGGGALAGGTSPVQDFLSKYLGKVNPVNIPEANQAQNLEPIPPEQPKWGFQGPTSPEGVPQFEGSGTLTEGQSDPKAMAGAKSITNTSPTWNSPKDADGNDIGYELYGDPTDVQEFPKSPEVQGFPKSPEVQGPAANSGEIQTNLKNMAARSKAVDRLRQQMALSKDQVAQNNQPGVFSRLGNGLEENTVGLLDPTLAAKNLGEGFRDMGSGIAREAGTLGNGMSDAYWRAGEKLHGNMPKEIQLPR